MLLLFHLINPFIFRSSMSILPIIFHENIAPHITNLQMKERPFFFVNGHAKHVGFKFGKVDVKMMVYIRKELLQYIKLCVGLPRKRDSLWPCSVEAGKPTSMHLSGTRIGSRGRSSLPARMAVNGQLWPQKIEQQQPGKAQPQTCLTWEHQSGVTEWLLWRGCVGRRDMRTV